jgi:hypothetical protein
MSTLTRERNEIKAEIWLPREVREADPAKNPSDRTSAGFPARLTVTGGALHGIEQNPITAVPGEK